jgi:hypothetical protein
MSGLEVLGRVLWPQGEGGLLSSGFLLVRAVREEEILAKFLICVQKYRRNCKVPNIDEPHVCWKVVVNLGRPSACQLLEGCQLW